MGHGEAGLTQWAGWGLGLGSSRFLPHSLRTLSSSDLSARPWNRGGGWVVEALGQELALGLRQRWAWRAV